MLIKRIYRFKRISRLVQEPAPNMTNQVFQMKNKEKALVALLKKFCADVTSLDKRTRASNPLDQVWPNKDFSKHVRKTEITLVKRNIHLI